MYHRRTAATAKTSTTALSEKAAAIGSPVVHNIAALRRVAVRDRMVAVVKGFGPFEVSCSKTYFRKAIWKA